MRFILRLSFIAILFSCNNKGEKSITDAGTSRLDLMAADKEFSSLSEEKGMKNAFIEYIDSNGVLLRPGHLPIIGANAIDYLIQQDDTGYTLSWEPRNAEVAKSGEMGYTYGIYAMRPKAKDTVIYGTYVSVWKKQQDGKWKLLLDTGNEGVDTPQ
jgi:ketosteroid isomerase-like protein